MTVGMARNDRGVGLAMTVGMACSVFGCRIIFGEGLG